MVALEDCVQQGIHHFLVHTSVKSLIMAEVKRKPMGRNIATLISKRVYEGISKVVATEQDKVEQTVKKSKEFKQLQALDKQLKLLKKQHEAVAQNIQEKYGTGAIAVSVLTFTKETCVQVKLRRNLSADTIRDHILLQEFFDTFEESSEEMILRLVKEFTTK